MNDAAGPPLDAWGWQDCTVTPLTGGLINTTYKVARAGTPLAVVQRMHTVFAPTVNFDIEAVTRHLQLHGVATPTLIRTLAGQAWVERDGTWRALTWIDGQTVHQLPDADWARAAGELVGTFHRATADLTHDYHFVRKGVHDTAHHLAQLRSARIAPNEEFVEAEAARALADEIADALPATPRLPALPARHCHGDLKISNILFAADDRPRAVALVDLDTVQKSHLAFELGDAMRSWCNPVGEDCTAPAFRVDYFHAALAGFAATAGASASAAELASVAVGLETICFELAARFCTDIFVNNYFGWDAARYSSRRAHNLVRARGQLALGYAVRACRDDLAAR